MTLPLLMDHHLFTASDAAKLLCLYESWDMAEAGEPGHL